MRMRQWFSYRRANNLLLIAVIVVNLYIIVVPFVPSILFWYHRHDTKKVQQLTQKIQAGVNKTAHQAKGIAFPIGNQPNQVIIPSILLDQTINEGHETYVELAKGVWRWPEGSTPAKGGNTVLVGHRFTYTSPEGVFYALNRVKLGNLIGVIWNNVTYTYDVTSITQVNPDDTAILNPSTGSELTLYTCTPLVTPKYRLVVVAKLETQA